MPNTMPTNLSTFAESSIKLGSTRAVFFGELPPGLQERLVHWAETETFPGARKLVDDRTMRWNGVFLKLFPPKGAFLERFRAAAAIRAARQHARIRAVVVPRPFAGLWRPNGRRLGVSLLATEYIEGPLLSEAWGRDPRAVGALPAFLAQMHKARILHGDLHPRNMIWNGSEWVLVDLSGLRHPLHVVRQGILINNQWRRLWFGLGRPEGLRHLFEIWHQRAGIARKPEDMWASITQEPG